MEGWQHLCLSDIAEIVPGFAFKGKDFGSIGIKTIKIKDIISPYVDIQNADCIDISHYDKKKLEKFNLHYGDFIVAMTGATIGKVGIFLHTEPAYINQRVAKILPQKNVDKKFVYYALVQDSFQSFIQNNIDSNSAQENISSTSIGNFPVLLPQLPERQAIAAVLSSLDDKIDLLHRQNKTLEALAQTLFRQWFVEEADSGVEASLSDFAENIRENVTADNLNMFNNYIGLEHIEKKQMALYQHGNPEDIASNKSKFLENDILFGKLRPYFHKVTYAPFDGICSTDILVIRPLKEEFFAFCLCLAFSDDFVQHSDIGSEGTRMPRTNWNILSGYRLPKPDLQRIRDFNVLVMPSITKMTKNISQIRTLTKLRDTLLPKLMSGEVRVEV